MHLSELLSSADCQQNADAFSKLKDGECENWPRARFLLAYNLISHTFSVDGEHLQRTVLLWYYMELFEVKDIWSMVI